MLKPFFFVVLSLWGSLCGAARELKVAVYDFPPHVLFQNDGPPRGAVIDFIKDYVASAGFYSVSWQQAPFARFLIDMEKGRSDMGVLLAKTPEREKRMRFSAQSLFATPSGVIVPQNSKLKEIHSVKELKGWTLGHSQSSYIPQDLQKSGVHFDFLSGENVIARNMERLRLNRIDGIFVPTLSNGEYVMTRSSKKNEFRIMRLPGEELELYIVFRKDLDEPTYRNLNALITRYRSKYPGLVKKYLEGAP